MTSEAQIAELEGALSQAKEQWTRLDAKKQLLVERLQQAERDLTEFQETVDTYEKARILLQQSAEYARKQAKQQMETLVTNALQYVFGPLISFEIELEEHGSRAVAEMFVVSDFDGMKVKTKRKMREVGAWLTLRWHFVLLMETTQPRQAGPLLLDEPGKHVSGEYTHYLYEFLKSLATMFGRQIIMITHNQHLTESGDKAFVVSIRDGISDLEEIANP
ncbi:LOW QUALITY PROTEIN: chromosome segregation ATPase [Bacillus sp. JCM 19046]|nr:LOW QUALITY PROTEIN: chromosome segregation ATPase [Bacillus sp. JCM 19046]